MTRRVWLLHCPNRHRPMCQDGLPRVLCTWRYRFGVDHWLNGLAGQVWRCSNQRSFALFFRCEWLTTVCFAVRTAESNIAASLLRSHLISLPVSFSVFVFYFSENKKTETCVAVLVKLKIKRKYLLN
jgi:hypothetical protein